MPEASKRGRQNNNSDDSPAAKKTAPSSTSSEPEETVQPPVIPAKVFRLKHVFKEISTLQDDEDYEPDDWEDHFGFDWRIVVTITDNHLSAYVEEKSEEMYIEGVLKFDLIGRNADSTEKKLSVISIVDRENDPFTNYRPIKILEWEKLGEYTVDDELEIHVEVSISYMEKLGSNDPSKFDSSKSEVSDCILVARDQKFHVCRNFLATHSPYFKALLLGLYKEANMPEIPLPGLDPYDVENFLRVIYGYKAINDQNVEGLLLIADKHDTPIIKERCEEFLVEESEKSMKKLFDMFFKYNCDVDKIIDGITTLDEYKEVIGGDIDRFDNGLAKKLLKKSAEILLG
ncbi:unnamed protein product [Caenorhabditis brenneri]